MSRDAWMTLKIAKDGSRNYGGARQFFMGEEGAFNVPAIARRLGSMRQGVLYSEVTSPTRIDILAMTIEAELES